MTAKASTLKPGDTFLIFSGRRKGSTKVKIKSILKGDPIIYVTAKGNFRFGPDDLVEVPNGT